MAIRWKVGEVESAAKAIEAHNRRIRAFNKKTGSDLPLIAKPKTTVKALESRSELNRLLKSLSNSPKDFQIVRTKQGIEMTRWQKREIEKSVNRINRERVKRNKLIREKIGALDYGDRVQMGMLAEVESRRKKRLSDIKPEDFKSYYRSVLKQADKGYWAARDERYIKNYLRSIGDSLGLDISQKIKSIIKQMNPFDIVLESITNEMLHIDFVYSEVERVIRRDLIMEAWEGLAKKYFKQSIF